MTKIRVLVFLSTLLIVGVVGTFVSYYARGYRFSFKTWTFEPNGILVVKSEPDGASVFINGNLKTATNATISLPPGVYDVEVKKDGFLPWYKRLTIDKEVVTQVGVSLFRVAPSLSPITNSGAENPILSDDGSKIGYVDQKGLFVIDVVNLPLGFDRDPKQITDGNLAGSIYQFSPGANEILLTTSQGIFILQTNTFTQQSQRVNISSKKDEILKEWILVKKTRDTAFLKNLPPQLSDIFLNKTSKLVFSPDGQMILYTADASTFIPENLVRPLPGASTQKQERQIESGQTYVYDIKEDRNFLITTSPIFPHWLPTSRHLLLPEESSITILDYDGTNGQAVYSGAYIAPFAYPFSNSSKILILTNLGSGTSTPNLYSLTIK